MYGTLVKEDKYPVLQVGSIVGSLRLDELVIKAGEEQFKCSCLACGEVSGFFRTRAHLNAAVKRATHCACKKCGRKRATRQIVGRSGMCLPTV